MQRRLIHLTHLFVPCLFASAMLASRVSLAGPEKVSRILFDVPELVLDGVPIDRLQIEALDVRGQRDARVSGPADVTGLRIVEEKPGSHPINVQLFWDDGSLRLETDRATGRKVYIDENVIRVTLPDGRSASESINRLPGWWSLFPALVAVVIALILRDTLVALFIAIWTGVLLVSTSDGSWWGRLAFSFVETIDTALVGQLVPADGDVTHVQIILFTLFLGSLIGVMSASGGTRAVVGRLTPVTGTRRGGQMMTWFLGLLVFVDDYANSLLVGSTMRPVTDRLRISREKLAFLVDATAAPVSGLAIVSTWVGFEVGLIGDSFTRLAETNSAVAFSGDAYGAFLATLPYRFYPLLLLAFVVAIAWTGRDFGPMWRAERRAMEGDLKSPSAAQSQISAEGSPIMGNGAQPVGKGSMWNAIVPLSVLLIGIVLGFWLTGRSGDEAQALSMREVISNADSNRVLLVSSFAASITAALMAIATRSLSLANAVAAWLDGAKSMMLGAAILVLAWGVAMVCDADHLNTAGYLVEVATGQLHSEWMPAVAFLLSAAVSFATGSSWATMGLLIPLVVSVTYGLMSGDSMVLHATAVDRHPLMLASVGSVLAGSIFGDHCSPISDTTVLSSVASDCDHLAHVTTQAPYAICIGLVSLVCGCIPAGFGMSWMISLPAGIAASIFIVRFAGRQQE